MRILIPALVLLLALGAMPLAAQAESSPSPVVAGAAAGGSGGSSPGLASPAAPATPAALPAGPLDGALFRSDEECESSCFQQYIECSNSCAACDQCSCQLALCRAGCGVPYTGC
jgi:hypothetical protein